MITTEIYKGQGLGNQLACYITTRVIAKDNGYDFGIIHPENFKGSNLFNLDFEISQINTSGQNEIKYYYKEKQIIHYKNGADISLFDKELTKIQDGTKIDGVMQDEQYIIHRKDEIKEWLKIKKDAECFDYSDENTCIINVRGGEFTRHKDLYLNQKYWNDAVKNMLKVNKNLSFVVITDDVYAAKKIFPNYDVFHFSTEKDYSIIKNAHYLILSNSSFAFFPAWLSNNLKYCIAPKYWGRHNISDGYWSLGQNITKGWMYQDRDGNLYDYDTCVKEFKNYIDSNEKLYSGKIEYKPSLDKKIYNFIKNVLLPNWVKNIIKNIKL